MVCVAPNPDTRAKMVAMLAIRLGFATIVSDARKIIIHNIYSEDLSLRYFVLCDDFILRARPAVTQRLYEMAARGLAVVVGSRTIPKEYDFICEAFYPEDFGL